MSLGFQGIATAGSVGTEGSGDFVSNGAEDLEFLFVGAFGFGRIVEGPVMAIDLAREDGAGLVGVAAHSDYRFDWLI